MSNPALLATRYARRPLLLEPGAAQTLLQHLSANDPRGMMRQSRLEAVLRKVGIGRQRPHAQDHVDDAIEGNEGSADASAARRPMAYAPLWAQQAYGEPTDEGFAWSMFQGVACMEINSAIGDRGEYYCGEWYHGYDTILAGMRDALADERVKGLFIRLSSPGGVVSGGLPALSAFMREARGAAGGKPIHVYMDMACSAAYWVGAPADRVTAPRVGLVGSIGACLIHEDYSGAYAKFGLVVTPIQFGEAKTDGNSWGPLSPRALADLQAEIDQCGRDFVNDVHLSRPQLTPEALIATQARVYMANHDDAARSGLALGFVDALESEEEAFANLVAKVSIPQGSEAPAQSPPAAAQPARAAISPKKETPMAVNGSNAARAAELASRRTQLEAELTQIRADEAAAASTPATDKGEGDVDDETAGGEGEGTGSGEGQGDEGEGDGAGKTPKASESDAILASPEAQVHPHAAMAAARTGMTYDQFKAQVEAQGKGPQRGLLGQVLAGAKRLGPDGAAPEASAFGSALVADAKARGGR